MRELPLQRTGRALSRWCISNGRVRGTDRVAVDLLVRLNRTISPATLEKIRTGFTDIIKSGTFDLTAALPEEHEEAQLAALQRLKFRFDRHKLGRLRQLIDLVNQD